MGTFIGDIIIAGLAYVASIYTWPWLRTKIMGAKAEIDRLNARIQAISEASKPK